jgi:hypothetical protein
MAYPLKAFVEFIKICPLKAHHFYKVSTDEISYICKRCLCLAQFPLPKTCLHPQSHHFHKHKTLCKFSCCFCHFELDFTLYPSDIQLLSTPEKQLLSLIFQDCVFKDEWKQINSKNAKIQQHLTENGVKVLLLAGYALVQGILSCK